MRGDRQDRLERAEDRLKKAQKADRERDQARTEREASERAMETKTAGLKALRLAKEKAEADAKALEAPAAPKARVRKKASQR